MSDFQTDPFDAQLSPDGETRRLEIQRLALQEAAIVRHGHRHRRHRNVALACAVVLLIAFFIPHRRAPQIVERPKPLPLKTTSPITTIVRAPKPPIRPREILITSIETDPTITSRLTLPPQKPTWQKIGDDALLDRLTEAGKPAGLAYLDGRPIILFRDKPPHDGARPHHLN